MSLTQIPGALDVEPKKKRAYVRKPKVVPTSNEGCASQCVGNADLIVLPPKQARKRKENAASQGQRGGVEGASRAEAATELKKVRKPRAKKVVEEVKVQGPLEENQTPLATPKRTRRSRSKKATLEEYFTPRTDSYDLPDTPAPNSLGPPQADTTPRATGNSAYPLP